ncbi:unnamed protein product [Linum tenue]|uniref:Uncharacterized protein n=1 Tax=Linum tenue TaxID=586396 RepID=A0AAV0MHS6_9ROSI|nr:unnamed protein product [Linum tenue]
MSMKNIKLTLARKSLCWRLNEMLSRLIAPLRMFGFEFLSRFLHLRGVLHDERPCQLNLVGCLISRTS